MAQSIKYVNEDTTPLFLKNDGEKVIAQLLWGDRVKIKTASRNTGDLVKVSARGREGFVNKTHLSDKPLRQNHYPFSLFNRNIKKLQTWENGTIKN